MDHHIALAGFRSFQPEADEFGEFLAIRIACFQRQATCRQAVNLVQTDGTKIAGPLPDAELIGFTGAVHFSAQAQAREAKRFIDGKGRNLVRFIEHVQIEGHGFGHALLNCRHFDRAREIQAGREEIDVERRLGFIPQRAIKPEPDRAVLLIGQVLPFLRHHLALSKGAAGQFAGKLDHMAAVKRHIPARGKGGRRQKQR